MKPSAKAEGSSPYREDDNDMFGKIINLDKLLDDYYKLRGWDKNGVPTKEKLEELNLSEFYKFIL